jgi:predicted MFS family arabinose efflux permease
MKAPSKDWLVLGSLGGLGILVGQGFSRFSFGLLFPSMGVSLVGTTSNASFLAALYAAAYFVGVATLIFVTRRVAPLRLLVSGVVVSTIGLLSIGLARSESVVIFGLVVAGLGAAFTYVPALSFVGAALQEARRDKATGVASAGIGAGIIVARVLAFVFRAESTSSGWRGVWVSEAAIGAVASAVIILYALRTATSVEDRGVPIRTTLRMPHWLAIGMSYLCFGVAYSIYSNLAVKAWELGGLSGFWAANSLLLVAPSQMSGGILLPWLGRKIGAPGAIGISYLLLTLAVAEVGLRAQEIVLSFTSAVCVGLVSAGIPAQVVLAVRKRLEGRGIARDATTTVFGVITLMYAIGGLVGLLEAAHLSKTHGMLTSTFVVAALLALVGGLCALRATPGEH